MAGVKFHVNKKGEAGPCRAAYNCPYGSSEEHHDSPAEARQAYEKRMEAEIVPAGVSKENLGLRDLTKLARISSDEGVMKTAVEKGSDRTYSALADNPNTTSKYLVSAADKAGKPEVRAKLVAHNNYPVSSMTPEDAAGKYDPNGYYANDKLLGDKDLNDGHVKGIVDKYPKARMGSVVANKENQVSNELAVKLVESGNASMTDAIRSERYPADKIRSLDRKDVSWSDIRSTDNPEYLDAYGDWSINASKDKDPTTQNHGVYNSEHVARNENTPPETLDKLADNGLSVEYVYNNPNSSKETKAKAFAQSDYLQRSEKLAGIEAKVGGNLREYLTKPSADNGTVHPYGRNRGYSETKITFDTDKMEELGVEAEDVHVMMNSRRNFNAAVSFNPDTGEFRGAVDSTD